MIGTTTELLLRVNGIQAAFGIEFGLESPREQRYGAHVVHEVLLTHPHFDHFAQLDWLSMCLLRSGRPAQPRPLPIYTSQECWDNVPNRVHRYLAERSDFRPLQPGAAVVLGDVTVTPFAVDHGPKAPGAVGFVVQHGRRPRHPARRAWHGSG
jgi:mRNA degradation ribonuclease J1/J2